MLVALLLQWTLPQSRCYFDEQTCAAEQSRALVAGGKPDGAESVPAMPSLKH